MAIFTQGFRLSDHLFSGSFMTEPQTAKPALRLIQMVSTLVTWLGQDFLGGPKFIKQAWVINLQKGGTALFVYGLMVAWDNFSAAAWTYLALHGTYGLIWLIKHVTMPDPGWERRVTIGGAINSILLVLGPYWLAPVLLITDVLGADRASPSNALMAGTVALHTLGVVLMMAADAQKHFTLKLQRGLITNGLFARIRHPNYLGEMMLYAAYAILAGHWLAWAVLAWVWGMIFIPNMVLKEASMSRYPQWAAYKKRTGMLWPWPFGSGD